MSLQLLAKVTLSSLCQAGANIITNQSKNSATVIFASND